MKHLVKWRWQIRCAICLANIVHICIHATPLDSGQLDAALAQLDLLWITT